MLLPNGSMEDKMIIKKFHQLNNRQIEDVEKLVNRCLEMEGLERTLYLSNDLNFYQNLNCFYLIYNKDQLVSVLTIFEPFEEEAEISAYTLPEERRKGYFAKLFQAALKELIKFHIYRLLLITEPGSKSGLFTIQTLQAKYDKSEYLLEKENSEINRNNDMENIIQSIELKELQQEYLPEAARINSELYESEMEEEISLLAEILKSQEMKCYCFYKKDMMIGICNVNFGSNNVCIFGLGLSPSQQGKGYGKTLLEIILKKIREISTKNIILEVGSENQRAFTLYKNAGFQIKTQYDYYEYLIN